MIGGISVSVTTGLGAAIVTTAMGDNQVCIIIYHRKSPVIKMVPSSNSGLSTSWQVLLSSPLVSVALCNMSYA